MEDVVAQGGGVSFFESSSPAGSPRQADRLRLFGERVVLKPAAALSRSGPESLVDFILATDDR